MLVAILALQGAFAEHQQMLQRLGADSMLIRNLADWKAFLERIEWGIDSAERQSDTKGGLIIPGGESTAMLRIMKDEELMVPIRNAINEGMPVFGTCAGMILLAKEVDNDSRERLATMDINVHRNAYGRQLGSFYVEAPFGTLGVVPMTFIRAPYVNSVNEGVEVLAEHNGHIIATRQGKQLVCSFHPELNDDTRIHQSFLDLI